MANRYLSDLDPMVFAIGFSADMDANGLESIDQIRL